MLTDPWFDIVIVLLAIGLGSALHRGGHLRGASARLWGWGKPRLRRAAQRLALWLVALFFTFFGPFSIAAPALYPSVWAEGVNRAGSARDLLLSTVAMMVLSASDIVDNLLRRYKELSFPSQVVVPVALAIYFIAVVSAMVVFARMGTRQLPAVEFRAFWTVLTTILWIGIGVELIIAVEDQDG